MENIVISTIEVRDPSNLRYLIYVRFYPTPVRNKMADEIKSEAEKWARKLVKIDNSLPSDLLNQLQYTVNVAGNITPAWLRERSPVRGL